MKSINFFFLILYSGATIAQKSSIETSIMQVERPINSDLKISARISLNIAEKIPDDDYKLGHLNLDCTIEDGTRVGIIRVKDQEDFIFAAIKSKFGPAILANDSRIEHELPAYTVFSFYRECALHSLVKVTVRNPEENKQYSGLTIRAADCMAVRPTLIAMKRKPDYSFFSQLIVRLERDYGSGYVVYASSLRGCISEGVVSKAIAMSKTSSSP